MSKLAILGGRKAVRTKPGGVFKWPIVTKEMENEVLKVLRAGGMSGLDVTRRFERGFARWHGRKYGLGHNTGTAALHCAMFGVGIGRGDEIICPSVTYWASCLPVLSLGGTVAFADIDPETLCIDPDDIERRISSRTRAIVAVHLMGMPADMNRIMAIARRHRISVIEDVSHAHGALYKGKLAGTFGDVSCFSLMSGKSFACGEAGIMLTNDRKIYDRAIAFGHYERHPDIKTRDILAGAGIPWGGYKYRMHQLSSAVGLVQLKKYRREMAEIDRAMNYFWDLLEGLPGIKAHRPAKGSRTTKGGWYAPAGLYRGEELGGLSVRRFCEAVSKEGSRCAPGCNRALHLHPVFTTLDIYRDGRPTRIAKLPEGVDIREKKGSLPVAEGIQKRVFTVPWFKRFRKKVIEEHAAAFRKVIEGHGELLKGDSRDSGEDGSWGMSSRQVRG